MNITPVLNASVVIQLHLLAALLALGLGAVQLTGAFTFFPGRLLHQLVMANL